MGKMSIRNHKSKGEWLNAPGGPTIGVKVDFEAEFGHCLCEMDVNANRNVENGKLVDQRVQGTGTTPMSQEINILLESMITYDLVEVSQSFSTYQPVLRTLQSMDSVPLANSLVEERAESLEYLSNEFNLPDDQFLNRVACNLETWKADAVANSTTFDLLSQAAAIKHALSSEVSLIQGPPGTGKVRTYILIYTLPTLILCCPVKAN
jgi:hypothetical protein